MRFDRAFLVFARAVPLAGLVAVLLTGEAFTWLLAPACALTLAGMAFPERLARIRLSKLTGTALAIGTLGFAVFDFFYISGSLILAGTHYLVILLCLKLLSLEGRRDYLQLFALSFFLLLASTALSTEIYFLVSFLAFFIALTWALTLMTVKGEAEAAGRTASGWRVGRFFFGGTALMVVVASFFTFVIFLVIPRVGIGYFSKKAGALKMVGFSDQVELQSSGEVLLDPTAVMRVQFPGRAGMPLAPLYWRGRTFDRYDGKRWEDTIKRKVNSGRGRYGINTGLAASGAPLVQDIALEPLETTTLFAAWPAYMINAHFREGVIIDHSGSVFRAMPPQGSVRYMAYSNAALPGGDELDPQGPGLPDRDAERYLQLPEGSERLKELAAKVAAGESRPYRKAVRIKDYLRGNSEYSLDPDGREGLAPLDDFLFGSKTGFCGHFATAMALMLRAEGVPARVVSGFSGGSWNELGSFLLVREQDAHVWVEVYFPESGWVMFDPTPEARTRGEAQGYFSKAMDYFKFKWDRYVVFYNLRDQLDAIGFVSDALSKARYELSDAGERFRGGAALAGVIKQKGKLLSLTLLLSGITLLSAAMYMRRLPATRRGGAVVAFYREMERVLGKKGHRRAPGATPMEFARGLERGSGLGGVVYVTEAYNRARFGGAAPSEEEMGRIREIIRGIKEGGA